jgi:putative heme-binding domain-containing protein
LESEDQERAARRFLDKVQRSANFPWTPPLVEALSVLPSAQVIPQLRGRWDRPDLRDAMIPIFSRAPAEPDRPKFLWGLESEDPEAVGASVNALLELPADDREDTLIGAMRLLRRLLREPERQSWRAQIVELLQREMDFPFPSLQERGGGVSSLDGTYAPVFAWLARTRPRAFAQLDEPDGANPLRWDSKFEAMQLKRGDTLRGRVLYRERRCQGCHAGTSQLGPDLGGINLRLPRREIFDAVVFPNRHLAPGYRATVVRLKDGTTVSGVVAHESFDALFLQPDAGTTLRFSQSDIHSRHVGNRSFMPAGLLDGLNAQDLADLIAFLGTITPEP